MSLKRLETILKISLYCEDKILIDPFLDIVSFEKLPLFIKFYNFFICWIKTSTKGSSENSSSYKTASRRVKKWTKEKIRGRKRTGVTSQNAIRIPKIITEIKIDREETAKEIWVADSWSWLCCQSSTWWLVGLLTPSSSITGARTRANNRDWFWDVGTWGSLCCNSFKKITSSPEPSAGIFHLVWSISGLHNSFNPRFLSSKF